MERFKVRVTKDYLSFCAAHFIVFNGDECERLHGHNYKVAAQIEGTLDQNFLVFDFIALKKILRDICEQLDHRMLVPRASRDFSIEEDEKSVRMRYRDREWVFPRDDCCLLPVENTTAELLARWISGQLIDELKARLAQLASDSSSAVSTQLQNVRVEVEETAGQWAIYETDPQL